MADAPNVEAWRRTLHPRLTAIAVLFVIWGVAIQARLVHLQVFRHEEFVAKAERQQKQTLEVPALRGDIVDRENRVLATSASIDTIYAVSPEIDNSEKEKTAARLCQALDDCDGKTEAGLYDRLKKRKPFQYVKRHVSPDEAQRVRALALDGIGFMTESHRFYPNRNLLGPILGYVGLDNTGLGGLEQSYNAVIRGADGKVIVVTDAKKKAFDNRIERPPSAGASIEVTIDSVLQHEVERELAAGITDNNAESGVAIVMDPWTGEILAMASEPTFNPNVFGKIDPDLRHNRAIDTIYEPGSTFKIVTASAALEEKVLTPETLIDCAPGYIDVGSRRVHDVHTYGTLTFTDVIVKSSNVGAIRAGFRVGPERLERYVRRFGFGSRLLGQELPAESPGIIWSKLSDDALTSVSMGYQVGVTPLQMATAVNSIANGGVLMRPYIVRATIRNGVRQPVAPVALRRTVSTATASTLTTIMEGVVERGTAKTAQIDGYTIAGKTGTSAKLVDGQYSKSQYMSSFVGFFPSRKPMLTVLVVIDTPRNGAIYGGAVSAPIFKRIAQVAIRHLGIPRTIEPEAPVVIARASNAGTTRPVTFVSPSRAVAAPTPNGLMPDLRGLSARAAVRTLARVGLVPRLNGDGFVAEQSPAAGSALDLAISVDLRLERQPPSDESTDSLATP
jgi:cell division protein FtsI (penicillin-binding protein 3)